MTAVTIREAKKAKTRSDLIAAAVRLFAEHGIAAVTVEQIAAAANAGKGTVYNYFAAKEDIVVAFMAALEQRCIPIARRYAAAEAPLPQLLNGFAWRLLDAKKEYRQFVRAFLARMIEPSGGFQPYVVEMQTAIDATLTAFFDTLRSRGRIREDLDMPAVLLNFKTMHLGLAMLWALEGAPWSQTRKVVKAQMAMFAEAVKP